MLVRFTQICKIVLERDEGSSIVPGYCNSDIVENIFCQARGGNGQNRNPRYSQYMDTVNGILLGQKATTRKSNTGFVESLTMVKPSKLCRLQKGNNSHSGLSDSDAVGGHSFHCCVHV